MKVVSIQYVRYWKGWHIQGGRNGYAGWGPYTYIGSPDLKSTFLWLLKLKIILFGWRYKNED